MFSPLWDSFEKNIYIYIATTETKRVSELAVHNVCCPLVGSALTKILSFFYYLVATHLGECPTNPTEGRKTNNCDRVSKPRNIA